MGLISVTGHGTLTRLIIKLSVYIDIKYCGSEVFMALYLTQKMEAAFPSGTNVSTDVQNLSPSRSL